MINTGLAISPPNTDIRLQNARRNGKYADKIGDVGIRNASAVVLSRKLRDYKIDTVCKNENMIFEEKNY
jgi:hypothetical protein